MSGKAITVEDVRHVAKLARLHMEAAELQRFTDQLGSILHYVDKIAQLDVANVPPMAHALPIHNVLREDVVGPALPLEKVLGNAPQREGNFFAVPKIIGADEDSAS